MKHLVSDQVKTFLSQHFILKSYQSGFRPGPSAVMGTSEVLNDAPSASENK